MKKLQMILPLLLLMLLNGPVWAADSEPATEPAGPPGFGAAPSLFNLSFKGGSPQQLVEALTAASGSKPNALIPPELASVTIPPMELRSVDVSGVFSSLNLLWRNSMVWVSSRASGGGGHGSTMIWVMSRGQDARQTRAFYVGSLLKKFKIEDVTTAVRSTWELGGRESRAELKYHQDTQLLLALGTPEQLNSMNEVLAQLKLAVDVEAGEPKGIPVVKPRTDGKE